MELGITINKVLGVFAIVGGGVALLFAILGIICVVEKLRNRWRSKHETLIG